MRVIAFVVVAALGAAAWSHVGPGAPADESGADVADLAWLTGSWSGVDGKIEMEEVWMAPKGGCMLGLHRDVMGDRTLSFEFLRIGSHEESIAYFASPLGSRPTIFPVKEVSARRVVFENLDHDHPQRILYWIADDGALHARIEGDKAGKKAPMEWVWRKAGGSESRPK